MTRMPVTTNPLRIAIITGSSTSGTACIQKILSIPNQQFGSFIRGCYRTRNKAEYTTKKLLPYFTCQKNIIYESHIGVDANNLLSLEEALRGCDRALLVTPLDHTVGMENDAQYSINMIQSAIQCGISRIVHIGSWTVHFPISLPLLSSRFLLTERYLQDVVQDQIEWTVLRGGYFMSNLLLQHANIVKKEGKLHSIPYIHVPLVDTRDIGEAAAILLLSDDNFENVGSNSTNKKSFSSHHHFVYHRKFIECCGPQILSNPEIANIIENVIKKRVTCPPNLDLENFCNDTSTIPIFKELFSHLVTKGDRAVPSDCTELTQILGRTPTTLKQFVENHKEAFVGNI